MKDKQRKLDYSKYKKLMKKHKKELNFLNNRVNSNPWEFSFIINYLVETLKFMQDYYELGYNIWQSEESLNEIKKTLKDTIKAYEDWDNYEAEYYHLNEDDVFIVTLDDKKKCYTIDYKYPELYTVDSIQQFSKEYNKKRDTFFKLLSKNIEKWWD